MTNDYVKELIALINSENKKDFPTKAQAIVVAIQSEIREYEEKIGELKTQSSLIHSLFFRYAKPEKLVEQLPSSEKLITQQQAENKQESFSKDERRKVIIDIALELAREGNRIITVLLVIQTLKKKGIKLNVQRAGSVIGSVINGMREFERTQMGSFKYIGDSHLDKK